MKEGPRSPDVQGESGLPGLEDPSALPMDDVVEVFATLQKALRAYQLYDPNNPVYKRFVSNLRDAFSHVWESVEKLHVLVEEERLMWMGEEVYSHGSRSESLAFLLYKDGIRDITLLPGLEEDELEELLEVLHEARNVRREGDDLVTILWERDMERFRYSHVEYGGEGFELPEGEELAEEELQNLLGAEVKGLPGAPEADEQEDGEEAAEEGEAGGQAAGTVKKEDFNPSLYALDPDEMEYLHEELKKEWARDLREDVLSALFDRLEEPESRERQEEIVGILRTLMPNLLSRGAVRSAARVVEELVAVRGRGDVLDTAGWEAVEDLLVELSSEEVVGELLRSLEDGAIVPEPDDLVALFRHLRMGAVPPLLRTAEVVEAPELTRLLRETVAGIAENEPEGLLRALGSSDPLVVAGAAEVAAEMGLTEAASHLARLMESDSEAVRKAGVAAARSVPSSVLANAAQRALSDSSREVRIEAARSLASIGYGPAAARLGEIVTGKEIREADITEKIAVFEGYGRLGGGEAVATLDRLLNGKSLFRRKEPAEVRAAAALALGKVGTGEARAALEKAAEEDEPVVRSAVRRALQGEEAG